MNFKSSLLTTIAVIGHLAVALTIRSTTEQVTLTFHGAADALYVMTIPASAESFTTDNPLSVSLIDADRFDAYSRCTFFTSGNAALVGGVNHQGSIAVGPPQPIYSVSCQPDPPIQCLPDYASCDVGTSIACCGICAATKCRPTGNSPRDYGGSISMTLYGSGAGGEYYNVTLPLQGARYYTHNDLSLSRIVSDQDLTICHFDTVGEFATLGGQHSAPPTSIITPENNGKVMVIGPPTHVVAITCPYGVF
ncbi:hypothetical protein BP5796_06660 [Coleophoma crateriformis]|uniref:Uncharacterized protein n=1 Tax=Coleophoma crateriformis TaxID=565419 RepID=A0A3D8RP61_9HELO|nr:hypothetical protein BP5796_06660 [Coleophoma crateriformis]